MTNRKTSPKYAAEVRERAVRMVFEYAGDHPSHWAAITSIAAKFGCTPEMLRSWVRQAERNVGKRGGLTSDERAPEGTRTREPLAAPSQRDPAQGKRLFCAGGARPPVEDMTAFIDQYRSTYGVEPICKVLPIAPSTYHSQVRSRTHPETAPPRVRRDIELMAEIRRLFDENFGVYGVRKVGRQMRWEGFAVARCTIARLMGKKGLQGVIPGKRLRTTIRDKATPCPLGHVN